MSVAMNRDHPQAEFARQLHDMAATAMRNIAARGVALSPELEDIVDRYSISNDGAVDALRTVLPQKNGIEPLYVHADLKPADLRPETLTGATFKVFGPEFDIDAFYLGDAGPEILHGFAASTGLLGGGGRRRLQQCPRPRTSASSDFRRLQSRMMSSAFAFAEEEGKVVNNTSVMLLIEWRGRRLLVRRRRRVEQGLRPRRKRRTSPGTSLGTRIRRSSASRSTSSRSATTAASMRRRGTTRRTAKSPSRAPSSTPSCRCPEGNARPKAKAVVSTERTVYKVIPRATLLVEIAKRVGNIKTYRTS